MDHAESHGARGGKQWYGACAEWRRGQPGMRPAGPRLYPEGGGRSPSQTISAGGAAHVSPPTPGGYGVGWMAAES